MELRQRLLYLIAFVAIVSCKNEKQQLQNFELVSSDETKVTFKNLLPENEHMNHLAYQYYYTGSGVSIGDINNDGLQDIYFTANILDNALYLNQGNLEFKDITKTAGVAGRRDWCTGTTMADVNNDGFLDIYVCYSGRRKEVSRKNELFINQGDGTFVEEAEKYGLADTGYGTQASFFDYDKDGDLDMYLLNHNIDPPTDGASITKLLESTDQWAGDKLYENTSESGTPYFKDVSIKNNIDQSAIGFGLGVSIGDLNNDGWPDIYASNDYDGRDFLYINQGEKDGVHQGFKDELVNSIPHTSLFSMGTDIADLNDDGWMDIMILDMASTNNLETKTNMSGMDIEKFHTTVKKGLHYQYMYNTVQLNNGHVAGKGLKFSDVAQLTNLAKTDWSWGPLIADYNNDGEKDIYIANGLRRNDRNNDYNKHIRETLKKTQNYPEEQKIVVVKDLVSNTPALKKENFLFSGNGFPNFTDVTKKWGVGIPSFSNGASYADLDNDGDVEIVVNNVGEEAFIFKNNTLEKNQDSTAYLKVKFKGSQKNPFGIGAKVSVQFQGKTLTQENYLTRGYISSISPVLHFGLGQLEAVDKLKVTWPDGKQQEVNNLTVDQTLVLEYAQAKPPSHKDKPEKEHFIFNEVNATDLGLDFVHTENAYDDYAEQILLPHKYSQFGPCLSIADVNGDDLDDFYIGGAAGQPGELYIQTKQGKFIPKSGPWENHSEREDVSSIFFDANSDGYKDLLVVSGGNEFEKGSVQLRDRLYLNTGNGTFIDESERLPIQFISGGTVEPNDFDGDGDLDLFIGERHIPHKYPMLASGFIYENVDGHFRDVTQEVAPELSDIGLVTDATWADIDKDGSDDLVVVGEWMAVHIFYNSNGIFKRVERLPNTEGWWYAVDVSDLDDDGDQDIVVGNLGLNYKYKANIDMPFEVYASDFNEDNKFDIVLGIHEGDALYPLRGRQCSSDQLPMVKDKFLTYEEFGNATILDMVGKQKMERALNLKSKTFATTYFENMGDGFFNAEQLPYMAQLSSVNAIELADFDGDGHKDLVIAGNLYTSEVETPRNDAGQGLFLKGDGNGNYEAKYPYESGLYIGGDVKQTAQINIGEIPHLLIASNNAPIRVIRIEK